jgi:hypothetical protein
VQGVASTHMAKVTPDSDVASQGLISQEVVKRGQERTIDSVRRSVLLASVQPLPR